MRDKMKNTMTIPVYLRPSFIVLLLIAISVYVVFFNPGLSLIKLAVYLVIGLVVWVFALGVIYNREAREDDDD